MRAATRLASCRSYHARPILAVRHQNVEFERMCTAPDATEKFFAYCCGDAEPEAAAHGDAAEYSADAFYRDYSPDEPAEKRKP